MSIVLLVNNSFLEYPRSLQAALFTIIIFPVVEAVIIFDWTALSKARCQSAWPVDVATDPGVADFFFSLGFVM
jgi:hypothetical protein